MKFNYVLIAFLFLFSCTSSTIENQKKVFRYNQTNVTSLDPAFASTMANVTATTQLFNGLVSLNKDLKIEPSLAKSWIISEDLKTYTFNLHNNVFFHDHSLFLDGKGRKVTAYDVEYSLRRIIDTTDIYNKGIWIFKDKVLKKANGLISDTCFKAVNDSVFKIFLESPYPHFIEILSMPYAFVVPKEVAEHYGRDFRNHPIGTGPFYFKEWDEGNTLIYLKNENYFKKGYPKLDAVQAYFVGDRSQAFRMFMMGKLDYITGLDENSRDDVIYLDGSIKEEISQKYVAKKVPYLITTYLAFQLDSNSICYEKTPNHPYLNQKFRQALNYSIDRKRLVTYLRNSLGEAGEYGMTPPCVPYFNAKNVKGYTYQPELALKLLKESGVNLNYDLKLHVTKDNKALSEFLIKQWEEVLGVVIKIETIEGGVMYEQAESGKIGFFRAGWIGDYPNAENFLALFYGPNETPAGPNKTHFKNNQFDSLYQQSKYQKDVASQAPLFEQMDNIMMKYSPVIVLYHDEILQLQQKNVINLETNAMNLLNLEKVDKQ